MATDMGRVLVLVVLVLCSCSDVPRDVPEGFRLMEVRGDLPAGVSRDALGVERVHVYELMRE